MDREALTQRLACLLASYETDEPHVSSPGFDFGTEADQQYPEWLWEDLEEYAVMEHHGDCVKQACTCLRCFAEAKIHKARWLAERLG